MSSIEDEVPLFLTAEEALFLSKQNPLNVIFLDGSFKRSDSINSWEQFLACRISNSIFFDNSIFSIKGSPSPPMLVDPQIASESFSSIGIKNEDHLILYGVTNSPSISRVVSDFLNSFSLLFEF